MNNFNSLEEVYEYYNNRVVKVVNIKQILFYADVCNLQPDWIAKSIFNDRLVAYYGMERSKKAYAYYKDVYMLD